jgi:hypothetical protein
MMRTFWTTRDRPDDPLVAALLRRGYTAATIDGATVYCRMERVTGSRFANKICLTEKQITAEDKASQDAASLLNQTRHSDCSRVPKDCPF